MNKSESVAIVDHFDSCVFINSEKMLRLVATTKTMEELCSGVDELFCGIGVETKCSFHKLSDQAANENRLQITSEREFDGGGVDLKMRF
jgi:hypothetical protein